MSLSGSNGGEKENARMRHAKLQVKKQTKRESEVKEVEKEMTVDFGGRGLSARETNTGGPHCI